MLRFESFSSKPTQHRRLAAGHRQERLSRRDRLHELSRATLQTSAKENDLDKTLVALTVGLQSCEAELAQCITKPSAALQEAYQHLCI